MLGDGSTAVTCWQRSARGRANLPAPAPTSRSVVVGVTSWARRLTSMSSVRRGSALKNEEKGSQRSWPVTPMADRILCDCSRCAATRCFQASSADMLESPPTPTLRLHTLCGSRCCRAWYPHWTKTELLQRRLAIDRENIQHQVSRCWLGILEEGQAIFWSDAQRLGNVDNMEGGQLTQAELGARAVPDGDIDDAIAQRRNRGIRATGRRVREGAANNLLGLGVQDGETPRLEPVGQAEHGPGIVAGRVRLGC